MEIELLSTLDRR